jgi:hypothetical protein
MRHLGTTTAAATALVAAAVLLFAQSRAPARAESGAPDTTPPRGAVGGLRSPASGTLELRLTASDGGWGLANAEASLDDSITTFARLGAGACPEHPALGGPEPPPGSCPASVSGVALPLDTRSLLDGSHRLTVRVADAAANTATLLDRTIAVRNAPPSGRGPIASVTVGVAGGKAGASAGHPGGGHPPPGNGEGHGRCRRPKLKMRLARKPLWRTRPHHVPVLRYGRRYPYKGKLTCLNPSGKRVPAAKGTPVEVYYRVWHLSFKRPKGPVKYVRLRKIKVGKKGRLRVGLRFKTGRTILFRYHGPYSELAKSKLRLAIPPRTRKPPWGPR